MQVDTFWYSFTLKPGLHPQLSQQERLHLTSQLELELLVNTFSRAEIKEQSITKLTSLVFSIVVTTM